MTLQSVKHGLVENAEDYLFCSYGCFLDKTDESLRDVVMGQAIDRVNVDDDFD